MKATSLILICIWMMSLSCRKNDVTAILEGRNPKPRTIDTIPPDRYYSSDIIEPKYSNIYNIWRVHRAHFGLGGTFVPDFEYLLFKKNGIYSITSGDSTLEYGQVIISNQDTQQLIIRLRKETIGKDHIGTSYFSVVLIGPDTLQLHHASVVDGSSYWFHRIK